MMEGVEVWAYRSIGVRGLTAFVAGAFHRPPYAHTPNTPTLRHRTCNSHTFRKW